MRQISLKNWQKITVILLQNSSSEKYRSVFQYGCGLQVDEDKAQSKNM
jgi:hypothetical protein